MADRLTLAHALKNGRLDEFVAQEEARGIGPANRKSFDEAIKKLATTITPPRSKGRTSRSASRDGSSGK